MTKNHDYIKKLKYYTYQLYIDVKARLILIQLMEYRCAAGTRNNEPTN